MMDFDILGEAFFANPYPTLSAMRTLPFDGQALADALAIVGALVDTWGVPVQPHISSVTSRSLNLMSMIWFERTPDGIARMRGLRDELAARLVERGFPPSRESVDGLRAAMAQPPRTPAWAQVKAVLDPANIIAPGRYVVASATPAPR